MFFRKFSYSALCIVITLLYNQSTNAIDFREFEFQKAAFKAYQRANQEYKDKMSAIHRGLSEIKDGIGNGTVKIDPALYNKAVLDLRNSRTIIKDDLLRLYRNISTRAHSNTNVLIQKIRDGLDEISFKFYRFAKKYHPHPELSSNRSLNQ